MKVKKFQAATMPEAMKKVRAELGSDAVILNSKVIKTGGFLGMFKKNQTEVFAAIDPPEPSETRKETQDPFTRTIATHTQDQDNREIMNELKHLKSMLHDQTTTFSPLYQAVYDHLMEQEVDEMIAKQVVETVIEKHGDAKEPDEVKRWFTNELYEQMKGYSFGKTDFDKPFIHLVGPTGVGKTTTLAKLAADAVLNRRLRVGFITADTYRIAAIDQLKTYARILDIPLEVAYNLEDYKEAKEKFKDFDLVLVDTAGRNFRDAAYVRELKTMIDFEEDSDNFLVLGLTSKYKDMKDIFDRFSEIPIHQTIFTKVDETSRIGNAINMTMAREVGVAYVTNGQNVPDDIREASPMNIARNVMEGFDGQGSS